MSCCGEVVWVENVPGKGYHYCRSCKNEVQHKTNSTILPYTFEYIDGEPVWQFWRPKDPNGQVVTLQPIVGWDLGTESVNVEFLVKL